MKLLQIIGVFITVIIAIAAGWVYQSQSSIATAKPELEIPIDIDYYLSKVTYKVMNEAGSLDYELKSPYLRHFKRDDISRLDLPEIDIYRNDEHWHLRADSAELRHEKNTIQFDKKVLMEKPGKNSVKISADKAIFDLDNDIYHLTNTKSIYN